jgi:hypothetical protein
MIVVMKICYYSGTPYNPFKYNMVLSDFEVISTRFVLIFEREIIILADSSEKIEVVRQVLYIIELMWGGGSLRLCLLETRETEIRHNLI